MAKHVTVRITEAYRDKLALLAVKNRRSMAQQVMLMIDRAVRAEARRNSK